MPSDRRWVPIPVDDPTVTHAHVTFSRPWNGTLESEDVGEVGVPVPPDDQLTRDVDAVTRYFFGRVPTEPNDAAMRLRAAFQLGEEE